MRSRLLGQTGPLKDFPSKRALLRYAGLNILELGERHLPWSKSNLEERTDVVAARLRSAEHRGHHTWT